MDGISANDWFQGSAIFKSYNGKRAMGFFTTFCQCFVRISFKFSNARLYVTDNDMHCLSCRFC